MSSAARAFAVALVLMVGGSRSALSPDCLDDLSGLLTDSELELFTQYVLTGNNGPYDLTSESGILKKSLAAGMPATLMTQALFTQPSGTGAWDLCPVLPQMVNEALKIKTRTLPTKACMVPLLSEGFCLPSSCNPRHWSRRDGLRLGENLKFWAAKPGASDAQRTYARSLAGTIRSFSLADVDGLPASVVCTGETESIVFGEEGIATDEWSWGRIALASFCALALSLVAAGTLIEYYSAHGVENGWAARMNEKLPALADFSLISNSNAVFVSKRKGCFQCFDGLRTFSALWVVYGHFSMFLFSVSLAFIENPLQDQRAESTLASMAAASMDIAVDTFFVLSAFLATYFMVKKRAKQEKEREAPSALRFVATQYLSRYLRLTPLTVFVVFFTWAFLPMIGNSGEPGPYSAYATQVLLKPCSEYWWTSLVHLNNLVGKDSAWISGEGIKYQGFVGAGNCMGHTWYVSAEFQLFLLVPVLVLLYRHSRSLGIMSALLMALASISFAMSLAFSQGWGERTPLQSVDVVGLTPWKRQPGMFGPSGASYYGTCSTHGDAATRHASDVSAPRRTAHSYCAGTPWFRAPTYLTGVLLAFFWLAKGDDVDSRVHHHWTRFMSCAPLRAALVSLALLSLGIVVYGPWHQEQWSAAGRQAWLVLKRPLWGCAIAILSLLCFEHKAWLLGWFLGNAFWVPLSTLSFSLYLVHLPIIVLVASSFDHLRFNVVQYSTLYAGVVLVCCVVALAFHLLVEKPAVRLSKRLVARVEALRCCRSVDDETSISKQSLLRRDELSQVIVVGPATTPQHCDDVVFGEQRKTTAQ